MIKCHILHQAAASIQRPAMKAARWKRQCLPFLDVTKWVSPTNGAVRQVGFDIDQHQLMEHVGSHRLPRVRETVCQQAFRLLVRNGTALSHRALYLKMLKEPPNPMLGDHATQETCNVLGCIPQTEKPKAIKYPPKRCAIL